MSLENLHLGKLEQPRNLFPELVPFFAVLSTKLEPHLGQIVFDECRLFKDLT